MVVQAYILIQTEVGKAAEVAQNIAEVKGVTLAEDVTGPYDVIVRAEARNVDELGKLVVARVQSIDGITRTLTCPVVHILPRTPEPAAPYPRRRRALASLLCESGALAGSSRPSDLAWPAWWPWSQGAPDRARSR